MVKARVRVKHTRSFEDRLADEASRFRAAAEHEPVGSKTREMLMRRVQQAETASRMNDRLRPPK